MSDPVITVITLPSNPVTVISGVQAAPTIITAPQATTINAQTFRGLNIVSAGLGLQGPPGPQGAVGPQGVAGDPAYVSTQFLQAVREQVVIEGANFQPKLTDTDFALFYSLAT